MLFGREIAIEQKGAVDRAHEAMGTSCEVQP